MSQAVQHNGRPLSPHQRRILAAILALEVRYSWCWWTRDDIGMVVGAGGFHQTIQIASIVRLKDAGLIQTERSSWAPEICQVVRCHCGCWCWGLTEAGRAIAERLKVNWPADALERMEHVGKPRAVYDYRDEDEPPPGWDGDDDDDGDDPTRPAPVGGPMALVG